MNRKVSKAGCKKQYHTTEEERELYILLQNTQHSTQTYQVCVGDGYWNKVCCRIRMLYLKTH